MLGLEEAKEHCCTGTRAMSRKLQALPQVMSRACKSCKLWPSWQSAVAERRPHEIKVALQSLQAPAAHPHGTPRNPTKSYRKPESTKPVGQLSTWAWGGGHSPLQRAYQKDAMLKTELQRRSTNT